MHKYLFAAAVTASTFSLLDSAQALPAGRRLTVRIEGDTSGSWEARTRVSGDDDTCEYTIRWSERNRAPLGRTVRCNIEEFRPGNDFDCESNRRRWIDSLVRNGRGSCRGFDDFGQVTEVDRIIAGESARSRSITGIFESDSIGDIQNFEVR